MSDFFSQFARLLRGFYHNSRDFFYLALAGLAISISYELRGTIKQGRPFLLERASTHAVMIAPIIYFGFCMIDIQNGQDLIPLIPFVAIYAAVALAFVIEQLPKLIDWARRNSRTIELVASVAVIAFILYRNVSGAFFFERGFPTLKDQRPAVEEIKAHLEPGDKIFVYGRTEILVLSGLTNISKYFLLDRGKARYLDQVEPGGFDGWLERLKSERPKIVVLDRLGGDSALQPLQDWVSAEYLPQANRVFAYYVRR